MLGRKNKEIEKILLQKHIINFRNIYQFGDNTKETGYVLSSYNRHIIKRREFAVYYLSITRGKRDLKDEMNIIEGGEKVETYFNNNTLSVKDECCGGIYPTTRTYVSLGRDHIISINGKDCYLVSVPEKKRLFGTITIRKNIVIDRFVSINESFLGYEVGLDLKIGRPVIVTKDKDGKFKLKRRLKK